MKFSRKSFGITLTTVYSTFTGGAYLITGWMLLLKAPSENNINALTAFGLMLCILGVFALTSVYGLWSIQEWGRALTIKIAVASMVLSFVSIVPLWPNQEFTIANTVVQVIGIGISVRIINYFSHQRIKDIFFYELVNEEA